jgi:hypothetical protein
MEHLNKDVKTAIAGLGSNVTDKSVQCIGKCIGELVQVTANFDEQNSVPPDSSKHCSRTVTRDLEKVVRELITSKVLENTPGRVHTAFKKYTPNPMRKIVKDDLLKCMQKQFKKLSPQL